MSSVVPTNNEAINLLSLDGGGVRGVSSLVILDGIMRKIQEEYKLPEVPKPCEFFHMIAGTSTGGLIAIMLGRLRMSTKEALDEYDNCAAKIFSKDNRKTWSLSTKFRATALQEVIEGIVEKRGLGDTMRDPQDLPKGKAFVCVMPSDNIGKTHVVRSFWGDQGTDENWDEQVKIWEAARATTAASSFFKPQELGKGASARLYIDAAVGVNNPVNILLEEAVKELGSGRRLGCVVSIGTGTRDVKLERSIGGFGSLVKFRGLVYYIHLVNTLKNLATDGEASHRQLLSRLLAFPGSYYRFNVPEAAAQVKLHHYQKIPELKSSTARYLAEPDVAEQVLQVAQALKTDVFGHGLTLGLVHLDKEQVILSNKNPQSMRMTSSFFTGRQDILDRLDSFFAPRNTGGKPRREFLLHGMAGVGKTEVALKFPEVVENDRFQYVFYIDGSMPATIAQSYADIIRQHKPEVTGNTDALKNMAMRWMEEQTGEWLMIFDDCKLDERQGHLPGRGKGSIIYTSRSTMLGKELPPECALEVTPFSEKDAVELLLKASGRQHTSATPEDLDLARAIVSEMGALPLGIDKAAATIRDLRLGLDDYLQNIRDGKVRIISDPTFKGKKVENTAVYAALELSYEAIMARRKREGRNGWGLAATLAVKVLGLLCFYHHQAIPIEAMRRAATERALRKAHIVVPLSRVSATDPPDRDLDGMFLVDADGKWDEHYFGVGIRVLESFSLITLDRRKSTISMHVLVHRWARHRMDKKTYQRYSELTRTVLADAIVMSWKWHDAAFTRQLRPHLDLCLRRGPLTSPSDDYLAWLNLKVGWYYHLDKDFYAAEAAFLRCLHLWRVEYGRYSWEVINVLELLGALYHEIGWLADAEYVYLELIDRMHGRIKDCEIAMAEEDKQREQELAQEEHEPGQPGGSASSDVRSKRTRTVLMERAVKNLPLHPFNRVLESRRNDPPKDQIAVEPGVLRKPMSSGEKRDEPRDLIDELWILHRLYHADLARVYIDQGKTAMGKRLLKDTLQFLDEEGDIPKNHVEFLRLEHEVKALTEPGNLDYWNKRVNDIGDIIDTGDKMFLESNAYFQLLISHANCVLKNGMWDLAYKHFKAVYGLFDMAWGPCDRRVLETLRRMVDCNVEAGRCDRAVEIARDCLHRARKVYGENHQETVLSLEKLYEALLYQKLEDDEEGEKILEAAIVRSEVGLGPTHPTTKRIRFRLRLLRQNLKQPGLGFGPTSLRNADVSSVWQHAKKNLENMKARIGPQHFLVKRFARMVGDSPPSTFEEYAERVHACLGPHSSITKNVRRELELRQATLAETREGDDGASSPEARGEDPIELCTCGEPAHAEGSERNAVSDSDSSQSEGRTTETEVTNGLPDTQSDTEPEPAGDGPFVSSWDTNNDPVYFCGTYY
ncbi:hypothetical protein B0I37DRAFT_182169 [Chaetomium sp. MPI-CAGE-AT-0009]|nr:hypothetical protein B0I37DRAFT_182169 [Chaetomium sp. MPI-CAGE-AT-0009]